MQANGIFSSAELDMAEFLSTTGGDLGSLSSAFAARNFLLGEGVTRERFESCRGVGAVASHSTYTAWNAAHQAYLAEQIQRPGTGYGPAKVVDPNDPDECPETFRHIDPVSPFLRADSRLDLIRVEQIGFIAEKSGESPDRIKVLAQEVVASNRDGNHDAYHGLADVLDEWARQADSRPVFAGFWECVYDLFGQTPDEDAPDWADDLRDRIGLLHLNPGLRAQVSIDVLVFRYQVATVPKLRLPKPHRDSRPLVPPTVIDGPHSAAFCPAPRGELTGYTIDLGQDTPPLRQEVLHPSLAFRPLHVWRVGEIRRSIDEGKLPEARAWHLEVVRDHAGREDYALGTDADLLSQ